MNNLNLIREFTGSENNLTSKFKITLKKDVRQKIDEKNLVISKAERERQKLNNEFEHVPSASIDVDFLFKRVISDYYQNLTIKPTSNVEIEIDHIDINSNKLGYKIIKNGGLTDSGEISLSESNKTETIQAIANKKITSIASVYHSSVETLLDRFCAQKPKGGFWGILSRFFDTILTKFQFLESIWEALTGSQAKKLLWNLKVLSEVSGGIISTNGLTIYESLKYIRNILDRQKKELDDPALSIRLDKAIRFSEQIHQLHDSYHDKACVDLVENIQSEIANLKTDATLLLPVGYFNNGNLNEMLVEIKKENNNFTVTLISGSNKTRVLFDREMNLTQGKQSMRREIINVKESDLLAVIPTWIGLQTSPIYTQSHNSSGWRPFILSLRFDQSKVKIGEPTASYLSEQSTGHLKEVLSYVKHDKAQSKPDEAERFELAFQLRTFLDICKNNTKGLKNKACWQLIRTTAHQLVARIEKNKGLIGNTDLEQGLELSKIYHEIKELLNALDQSPPELKNLTNLSLPLIAVDSISLKAKPPTPILYPPKIKNSSPEVNPPFKALNPQNFIQSINEWGLRAKNLIQNNQISEAAAEVNIMVRILPGPKDNFWHTLTPDQAKSILIAFNHMGEAIARARLSKEEPSTLDAMTISALNYYAYRVAKQVDPLNEELLSAFTFMANEVIDDLMKVSISSRDKSWLKQIQTDLAPAKIEFHNAAKFNNPSDSIQCLLNISQFTAITVQKKIDNHLSLLEATELKFQIHQGRKDLTLHLTMPENKLLWIRPVDKKLETSFTRIAPEHAKDIFKEITNRYLTEFCPLGCIRDNCPNYAVIPHSQQRFYPLYLAHNFVEDYCPKLISKGILNQDEVVDLLYTQQTNKNAATLFSEHSKTHGFEFADNFSQSDYRFQAINTISLFLENPHFFKHRELRWHFENKLGSYNAFLSFLNSNFFKDHRPFLISVLQKLQQEIHLSKAEGNVEITAYLIHIAGEFEHAIESSTLDVNDKSELKKILVTLPKTKRYHKMIMNLMGKADSKSKEKQKIILPLFIRHLYTEITENKADDVLKDPRNLELFMYSNFTFTLLSLNENVLTQEEMDYFRSILSLALPIAKEHMKQESIQGMDGNKFVNFYHPKIAAKRLKWDAKNFPNLEAIDNKGTIYNFDLSTGELIIGNKIQEILPKEVKRHPLVQALYESAFNEPWKLAVNNSQKNCEIKSYSHQRFPHQRIVVRQVTGQPVEIILERMVLNEKEEKEWVFNIRFNSDDPSKNSVQTPDLPPAIAAAIGNRSCWMDRSKSLVYIMENGSNKPYAKMRLGPSNDNDSQNSSILDFHLIKTDQHLLQTSDKNLERFTMMEDPAFIQIVGKKGGEATKINFCRLELAHNGAALSYDLDKNKISTPLLPGYELAPYGARPGKKDPAYGITPLPAIYDHFHLFRKDGSEKVLIPFHQLNQLYDRSGEPMPFTTDFTSPESSEKTPVFEYTVDPETNRLKAKTSDAYAYLAYICGTHQDYASAIYYLDKARSSTGYDAKYLSILTWSRDWVLKTPNNLAMRLKFELFQEKILADYRIRHIKEGKLLEINQIDSQREGRLARIAEDYEQYVEAISKQTLGITGVDPSLMLSPEELNSTKLLIRELIDQHGDLNIPENIEKKLAAPIPLQAYLKDDKCVFYGLNEGALNIWAHRGKNDYYSTLSIQDPRWILSNFESVFNQLLILDKNSARFKQLSHQVRILSELPLEKLSQQEKKLVYQAQFYLVKLISAKKNDPNLVEAITDLLPRDQLPKLSGSFFSSIRKEQVERANYILTDIYTGDNLENLAKAKLKSEQSLEKIRKAKAESPRNIDAYDVESFAKKALVFIEKYQSEQKQLQSQNKELSKDFSEAFRDFALKEFFGESGKKSIQALDEIFTQLKQAPTTQDKQFHVTPKNIPKLVQTYKMRYEKLTSGLTDDTAEKKINNLEKIIQNSPAVSLPVKIITPENKFTSIQKKPLTEDLKKLFVITTNSPTAINEKIFDDLKTSPKKAVVRLAEEHRNDMQAAKAERIDVTLTKDNAQKILSLCKNQLHNSEQVKEKAKQTILQMVEKFSTPAGIAAMRRLRGEGVKVSLDQLVGFWRRNEITNPWDENPLKKLGMQEICAEDLILLDKTILEYARLTTETQHAAETIQLAEKYLESFEKEPLGKGDSEEAKTLYEQVSSQRYFSFDDPDSRDLLFIESRFAITLRKAQVETIREMVSDPNAVRQLGMGGGKSKVILPLVAKMKATGKNLVMLLLPDALYETNCKDLNQTNRELFGQEMHRFDFSRSTNISKESLQLIHIRLLETVRDKGFIMTTKRSLLSFRNAYINLINQLKQAHQNKDEASISSLCEQVREMSKIMKLFRDQGDVIADEVDACLDIRKEVNFSVNDDPKESTLYVETDKISAGIEMMELILLAAENTPLFKLKQAIETNTQAALSPDVRKDMLAQLTRAIHAKYKSTDLSEINEEKFVLYVTNQTKDSEIEKWAESLKTTNVLLYKKISSFKALIDQGFSTTFNRIGNVNYGRDPISGIWTIPWAASGSPNIGSEFDDDIERIAFTMQDYVQNGVTYEQVYKTVAKLRTRAANELRGKNLNTKSLSLNKTEAAKEFKELLAIIDPNKTLLGELQNLSIYDSPERIASLTAAINESAVGKLTFCKQEVLKKMRKFTTQISSVSMDLPDMVHNFGGFTGTPWNRHTYHDKINTIKTPGVDGRTWSLLLDRNIEIHTFDLDSKLPVESLMEGLEVVEKYQAIGDAGAYLRGVSNDHISNTSLEIAKNKGLSKATIHFDETGTIVKKLSHDSPALPLENAPATHLMDNLTIYDQAHTVGADIKQGQKAVLLITIGENLFIRDLFQTIWRFRQADRDQKIVFGVSNQIKDLILNGEERELTIEDILKYCLINEAERESPDNYKAEKEKIKGFPKRLVLSNFIDAALKLDDKALSETAAVSSSYLLKTKPAEKDYDAYVKLKKEKSPEKNLSRLREQANLQCQKIGKDFQKLDKDAKEKFMLKGIEIKNRKTPSIDLFPNKVVEVFSETGGEVELDAQMELEAELNLELEVDTEQETQVFKEDRKIPMVTGSGAHGDVEPINENQIIDAIRIGQYSSSSNASLKPLAFSIGFFDPTIFCTTVFERNLNSTNTSAKPNMQSIFYSNRKPIKHIFIAKSNSTRNPQPMRMIIPTIHEAHGACRTTIQKAEENDINAVQVNISKGAPLIIYKSGEDRSNELPFKGEDLKQFYVLYIQAKLFNGEIDFKTEAEVEALQTWLKKQDAVKFRDFFEKNILAAKPKRFIKRYFDSSLHKILDDACNPKPLPPIVQTPLPIVQIPQAEVAKELLEISKVIATPESITISKIQPTIKARSAFLTPNRFNNLFKKSFHWMGLTSTEVS